MRSSYLSTTSPSPTAVKYTISSRAHHPSRPALYLQYTIRSILTVYALLIASAKLQSTLDPARNTHTLIARTTQSLLTARLSASIDQLQPWVVLPLCLAVLYLTLKRPYTEESLLVLGSLGLQISTSSAYLLFPPATTFIPATAVQDIIIHEAFRGFEVRFYLAVIVRDAPELTVVFPQLLPRREELEVVWRGARACLNGGSGGMSSGTHEKSSTGVK